MSELQPIIVSQLPSPNIYEAGWGEVPPPKPMDSELTERRIGRTEPAPVSSGKNFTASNPIYPIQRTELPERPYKTNGTGTGLNRGEFHTEIRYLPISGTRFTGDLRSTQRDTPPKDGPDQL